GGAAYGRADRVVLFFLDGGHDRIHVAVPGPRQDGQERAFTENDHVGRSVFGVEEIVFDAHDTSSAGWKDATTYCIQRLGGGGLIKHGRGRCAPIDQQDIAVGVADTDPADVAGFSIAHIEPAEHKPVVGGVQCGDAAAG